MKRKDLKVLIKECIGQMLTEWTNKLQSEYSSFEEWEHFSDTYGLSNRLGYETAQDAWDANPIISGGVNPKDYKVVRKENSEYQNFMNSYDGEDCPKCKKHHASRGVSLNVLNPSNPTVYQCGGHDGCGHKWNPDNEKSTVTKENAVAGKKHVISKPVKDTSTGEWVVKWMTDGKRDEDKTYYTDDLKDAQDTAKVMAKHAEELNSKEGVVKESAPPKFPADLRKKIVGKYGNTAKAYQTMWKIHKNSNGKLEEMWNGVKGL